VGAIGHIEKRGTGSVGVWKENLKEQTKPWASRKERRKLEEAKWEEEGIETERKRTVVLHVGFDPLLPGGWWNFKTPIKKETSG